MSANKIKHVFRTIMNVDSDSPSKNKIYQILRKAEVHSRETVGNIYLNIDNQIRVGNYIILLEFSQYKIEKYNPEKLRDYGHFNIKVYEKFGTYLKEINLSRNEFFKHEPWINRHLNNKLRICDLVEVIILCARINQLNAFN